MKTIFYTAIDVAIISITMVMFVIGLSMVRFAELPEKEIEVPKEAVCEKTKF